MTSILRRACLASLFLILFAVGAAPASAGRYVKLPQAGGHGEKLKIRVVRYDGSTNGKMVVEVANTGKTSQMFIAEGLYFVPGGDPEKAPQRLGAAGPFSVITAKGESTHLQQIAIGAGETKRLNLEVFCIDSHRGSPSSSTSFNIAGKRLPKQLRQEIAADAAKAMSENEGDFAKAAPAIQSSTWKNRDKKWIKLQGERKKEKDDDSSPRNERPQLRQQSR